MAEEKKKETSKYQIGEFSFETFHEYRDGQEDVRKIECINKELNIQDPEVAVRLYNDIRGGKIVFKTAIGDQFYGHLADIVAEKSVDLLEDKAVVEEAEGKVKYQKYIGLGFIILALVSFAIFGIAELRDVITTRQLQKLQNQVDAAAENDEGSDADAKTQEKDTASEAESTEGESSGETAVDVSTLTVQEQYKELLAQNADLVGWVSIDGTEINYPVVQKEDDNTYYLDHSFDGSSNANGTIFMDYRCSIVNATTNTILYGHNMKSGMMFGGLKNYLQEGYLKEHSTISFQTLYENYTYQILAVCLSEVQYQDEAAYRYYDFISAGTQSELDTFIANVDALAVYGSVDSLTKTDKILTLSTCNSYTEDGRLFVVAKRIN